MIKPNLRLIKLRFSTSILMKKKTEIEMISIQQKNYSLNTLHKEDNTQEFFYLLVNFKKPYYKFRGNTHGAILSLVKHFVIMFRKYLSRITSQGFRNHDTPKMGLCIKRQQLVAPSYTTRKAIYFFPKCLEKMVFPKKVALKYNLHILFSKNIILYFRREIKDDLS